MKLLAKIVLCITIFIIIGAILLAWKAPSIIRNYSEEYVSTKTNDNYKLQFEKVNIRYLPFGVELENVSLQALDSTYINLGSSAVMVESEIDKVDISSINILRIITGSDVRFHLLFENPNFTILSSSDTAKAIQLKKGNKKTRSILLKSLTLNNAHINYSKDMISFETDMNYKADHLGSDNFINDIKTSSVATLLNVSYTAGNGLRTTEIEKVTFDRGRKLNLLNIHLKTKPGKYKIGQVLGHEASWYDVNIDSVSIINENLFFHNDTLKVEELEIAGLNARMFRDKRLKFPNIPDKPMIKDIIKGIKLPLTVDSISLRNGYISYQEHHEGYEDAGTITFEKLTLTANNLSTLDTNNELKYQASAVLMGKGFLEIEGTVPQAQNNTTYHISGVIHPHDLKVYNPMLNFVAGIEITSGSVKKSTFNFSYNNVASNGSLNMVYDNLNVKFTDSEGNVTSGLDGKLKNFITNTFVVKKDNEREGDMRVGKIEFDRNPKKSFLNYWWKSLLSGIKSSTGIKTKKRNEQ